MTSPHRESIEERIPLADFITFRAFGTWLHGDQRGSVDPASQQIRFAKTASEPSQKEL